MTLATCRCEPCRRDRVSELLVACSRCKAPAGERCRSNYRAGYLGGYHGAHTPRRTRAAFAWLIVWSTVQL